jgi:hypothetical protein
LGLAILMVLAAGSTPALGADEKKEPRGVIYIVGGVGGFDITANSAERALPKAGVRHEIRDFDWNHRFGSVLRDLQDRRRLELKAKELAEEIMVYRAEHPEAPIYVLGKSGGAGLVLSAAEHLPEGTLERLILLSAAVSPTYDLRPALRATKREVVSFHSRHDKLVLGWGTEHFGTADRIYGRSAGLCGFSPPEDLDDEGRVLYERLVQVPWNCHMIKGGNLGNHLGTSAPGFLKREVAPWLRGEHRAEGDPR